MSSLQQKRRMFLTNKSFLFTSLLTLRCISLFIFFSLELTTVFRCVQLFAATTLEHELSFLSFFHTFHLCVLLSDLLTVHLYRTRMKNNYHTSMMHRVCAKNPWSYTKKFLVDIKSLYRSK